MEKKKWRVLFFRIVDRMVSCYIIKFVYTL